MAPVTDEMYELVLQNFNREEVEIAKDSDIRKKIQEKREVEEAKLDAVRQEIDEVLELSKASVFEPVRAVKKSRTESVQKKAGVAAKKSKEEKKEEVAVSGRAEIIQKGEEEVLPEAKTGERARESGISRQKEKQQEKITADIRPKAKEAQPVTEKKEERGALEEKPKRHLKRRRAPELAGETEEIKEQEKYARKKHKVRKFEPISDELTGEAEPSVRKKKKKKRKKQRQKIDEKEIEASIKETMAKMGDTARKRRYRKEKSVDEAVIEETNVIRTTEFTSVAELAAQMNVEPSEVIQACIGLGLMVSINQRLDRETIMMLVDEFGYDVIFLTEYGEEEAEQVVEAEDPAQLESRPAVVTIMGHVDHGKTSLLDFIRQSNIIAGESGGITQHIGAYEVTFKDHKITFLDTPGHEAFTAMRARGAQITDIVVLVVAADDSVMPQTVEAINHSRAAGVPIMVAINKMDKHNANPDAIKKQLSEHNILVEDWGGKVQCALVSAKTGEGIERLLEMILLEAEILELKANPHTHAGGVVVEAEMDRGKGIMSTVLVQKGTLHIGDSFVAGQHSGRVRAMFDERGHAIFEAPPSTPVQVLGLAGMPQAGDMFRVFDSEHEAREVSLKRQQLKREQDHRQIKRLTLDQISKQIAEGAIKELSIILKADVDGSMQVLSDSLMDMGTEDVAVRIIHKGVGTITESDVLLAQTSRAVIIGFHVKPNTQARDLALRENVDIRLYKVIYDVVNDVKLALAGLLEPEYNEEIMGTVEIREVFKASRVGAIAGCYVLTGKIQRNYTVRLIREGSVLFEGKIATLKRFKEDVKEVSAGFECGLTLEGFKDIQQGDQLEVFRIVETARTL